MFVCFQSRYFADVDSPSNVADRIAALVLPSVRARFATARPPPPSVAALQAQAQTDPDLQPGVYCGESDE